MFGNRDILGAFLERLKDIDDVAGCKSLLAETIEPLGIAHFAYHLVRVAGLPGPLPYAISTYPESWVQRYVAAGYLRDDPLIEELPNRRLPFLWSDIAAGDDLTPKQRKMFAEAREHGLINGLTVPIHAKNGEFATVSFVPGGSENAAQATIIYYRHLLHLLALYYHDHAVRILIESAMTPPRQKSLLSPREKEVLLWTARGKSNLDISTILGISEKGVEFHINSAKRKLQVFNRTHAVVKAIMLNMIRVD
ncbi:MAG: LuxR family transcriptional regulator [Pseudomonadota bacterium]